MSNVINVGIIGFGLSGKVFHAPIINGLDGFKVTKIVTSDPSKIKAAKNICPDATVVDNTEEIYSDGSIKLVVVATPNIYHRELASKALLGNKHVVVEKPFTITSEDADYLISLAKNKNKILTVYQNRRWDSDFLTVKKIIEQGYLGNVVELESHFDRFRNYIKLDAWREEALPGSGMVYDLGSHLIDQSISLFGLPTSVFADIRSQRIGSKVDDNFEIVLFYEKLKVTLKSSMLVREPLPRFIVLGDQGSFVKYGLDLQEGMLKDGLTPSNLGSEWGKEPETMWGTLNTEINGLHFQGKIESERGNYNCFYRNVYNAIQGTEELIVKPETARNTIRIIELAVKSNSEKRVINFY